MISDVDESAQAQPRHLVEFVLVLLIATLVFKGFVVDGYFVPTGSMAPGLVGLHNDLSCPECHYTFAVGRDSDAWTPHTVTCPQCRRTEIPLGEPVDQPGDRLLVLKGCYQWLTPKRWESVVFLNPNDIGEAYVKRIVGLPGETITIRGGDIYIQGRIQRKTFEQFRALAIPVYDSRVAARSKWNKDRWVIDGDAESWNQDDATWSINSLHSRSDVGIAFQDLSPAGEPTPLVDEIPYNATRLGSRPPLITDFAVRAKLGYEQGDGSYAVSLHLSAHDTIHWRHYPARGTWEIRLNDRLLQTGRHILSTHSWIEFDLAYWDAQIEARIDGQPVFSIGVDSIPLGTAPTIHPVRFSANNFVGKIDSLEIHRDIYYRTEPPGAWPGRKDEGFHLGPDEYFMLGDNSAVSNDSRSWDVPGIPRRLLVGKPILVHLPMQAGRGKIAGRSWRWQLPDWRRIRRVDAW
jgi:signal peptidase I